MPILTTLANDWQQPGLRRQLRRRYPTWAHARPALRVADNANDLLTHLRTIPVADTDRPLLALVTLAAGDELAGRTVLQALLPGLNRIARHHRYLGTADDVEAALIATAWEHIRTYPTQRRPRRVAANLLMDTQHHLRQELRVAPSTELHDVPEPEHRMNPSEELQSVITDAVASGLFSHLDAEIVVRTRILDEPISVIAGRCHYPPDSIRHQRQRAERRLRVAL